MAIEDTEQVLKITSEGSGHNCPVCKQKLDGTLDFDGSVNHMLDHGWTLLHVGSEFGQDEDHKTIHFTVAVVGRQ